MHLAFGGQGLGTEGSEHSFTSVKQSVGHKKKLMILHRRKLTDTHESIAYVAIEADTLKSNGTFVVVNAVTKFRTRALFSMSFTDVASINYCKQAQELRPSICVHMQCYK